MLEAVATDTPAGYRTRAVLELLYASGIRAGELVGLDVGHMDFSHRIGNAVFEVGGRGKGTRQFPKSTQRAYVVKDDTLVGDKRTIPLYLMGSLF
jgi:integrase/recombinase XerC